MRDHYILSLRNINKKFPGTNALTDVTFDVHKGELHALVGENGAGKSTMMNIIGGVFAPTSGKIIFDGEEVTDLTPLKSREIGIGFVHQETSLCPHVSVAENIYIGRIPLKKNRFVDFAKLYEDTQRELEQFHCDIRPQDKVADLTVAQQQIVEITRAISMNCRLLILDEPTASLTNRETEELFRIIRQLKAEGISIIYISHRLSEIMELCDRVTVLRDGRVIDTKLVEEIDTESMISMMVGRKLQNLYPAKGESVGNELLRVSGMSGNKFRNISFCLKEREILGFSGLVGAGRSELMRGICGIDHAGAGEVFILGEKMNNSSYRESLDQGLVYMTEDRKAEGLFLTMPVKSNMAACVIRQINGFLVKEKNAEEVTKKYVDFMNIKLASYEQLCGALSGGNQQKVLLGKSLAIRPKVLIVDEPTRGIDVGAKFEVYKILRELCAEGIGIIMVSSDLPEVVGMCDRVIVMYEGNYSGELTGEDITEEKVMKYAAALQEE